MEIGFYLLAIIIIASVTYLAYRYPAKYERLFNPLYIITFTVYVGLSVWNTGTMMSLMVLSQFIKEGEVEKAQATIKALQIPWIPLHTLVWFLFLYFLLLSFLPRLLEREKKKRTS
jgi:hypothetical protein